MATNSTSVQSSSDVSRLLGAQQAGTIGQKLAGVWIPLLLGLSLATAAALLIIQQEWILLIALVLMVPAAILVFVQPFLSVMVWLLLFPFFLQEFMPGARMIYWLLYRAMIPATIGVIIFQNTLGMRRNRPFRLGLVDLAMLAFLTLSLINILLLTDRPVVEFIRFYDRMIIPFCMFWLFRLLAPTEQELRWLTPIALFIIVSQGVVGLLSWFAPGVLPAEWLSRVGDRTIGTLGNPAVYSSTLVFCALLLMQTAQLSTSFWKRAGALAAIGAAFFIVFFTFSRGSWLGALVVWMGLGFLYPKPILKLSIIGTLVVLMLLTRTSLSTYSRFAQDRLLTQSTAEGRIISGAATMRMIADRPFQGWGYGNHELYDEQYRGRVLDLAVKRENSSHNTFLLMTAEMGLPGLLLYLTPVFLLLAASFRYLKWIPKEGMMGRTMLFMLWLLLADHFITGNFTDLIRSNFFSTVIWWMVLAWIANIVDTGRAAAQTVRRI